MRTRHESKIRREELKTRITRASCPSQVITWVYWNRAKGEEVAVGVLVGVLVGGDAKNATRPMGATGVVYAFQSQHVPEPFGFSITQ